ncbi:MAG: A/G-specific adenine glycosylase [Cyclobacteriaceae bacterium]|nr:A/G-specific adenine glycosylase [Cyclobacteriaceae bacterium]
MFSATLVNWYQENKRDLPWRKTINPYKIWLSEIILQQTRVIQGLPYYTSFITNFPTVNALANAPEEKILRLWQGLGYYSRAKNLHKCAKIVVDQFQEKFPTTYDSLLKLPGIGPYTAAAIASFCYHQPIAVVDGNVYRVLSRIGGITTDISSPQGVREFKALANVLIDHQNPDSYNQAIMEFGALQCIPKKPSCPICPLKNTCFAYLHQEQHTLPVKLKKTKIRNRFFYYLVITINNKIVMNARKGKDIWQGLYDFPVYESEKRVDIEKALTVLLKDVNSYVIDNISEEYKHILSHQHIYGRFIKINITNNDLELNRQSFSIEEIIELPKPILINNYLNQYIF